MKKDKLNSEKFFQNQIITLRVARTYKNGRWNNYAPEDDYIVSSISTTSIKCYMKGNKKSTIELTDESIRSGIIRIIRTEKNPT